MRCQAESPTFHARCDLAEGHAGDHAHQWERRSDDDREEYATRVLWRGSANADREERGT